MVATIVTPYVSCKIRLFSEYNLVYIKLCTQMVQQFGYPRFVGFQTTMPIEVVSAENPAES
jgi:hypothetical protein